MTFTGSAHVCLYIGERGGGGAPHRHRGEDTGPAGGGQGPPPGPPGPRPGPQEPRPRSQGPAQGPGTRGTGTEELFPREAQAQRTSNISAQRRRRPSACLGWSHRSLTLCFTFLTFPSLHFTFCTSPFALALHLLHFTFSISPFRSSPFKLLLKRAAHTPPGHNSLKLALICQRLNTEIG